MKKTLIALAVGSAFAAPAAYADVTISGAITAGPTYLHQGGGSSGASNSIVGTPTTGQAGISKTGIDTNYSNITIGSLEDLGGGMKLDFAFQIIAPFQGNQAVSNRNSHIGLVSDSWGGVWYGSNEQLYESYFYTVDPLDGAAGLGGNLSILGSPGYGNVFGQQSGGAQQPGVNGPLQGNPEFYNREENAIWYNSPNFNGFTFGVYGTLSTFKTNADVATGTPGTNPTYFGFGGKYVGPTLPIQVWAAYENHHDLFGLNAITSVGGVNTLPGGGNGATSSSDHGWQVGAGYTFGDIFAYANFEQLKYQTDGLAGPIVNEYQRNAWSIGAKWNISTGYIGGQYVQGMNASCTVADGSGCSASGTGGKMVGVGYYHTMSKQTQAYVMATYIKNDSLQSYTIAGGGDSAGTGLPVNLGSTQWGAIVGLKHSF
jgi:predicted porin